eukprot:2775688-Amphidinium_carterae.1
MDRNVASLRTPIVYLMPPQSSDAGWRAVRQTLGKHWSLVSVDLCILLGSQAGRSAAALRCRHMGGQQESRPACHSNTKVKSEGIRPWLQQNGEMTAIVFFGRDSLSHDC